MDTRGLRSLCRQALGPSVVSPSGWAALAELSLALRAESAARSTGPCVVTAPPEQLVTGASRLDLSSFPDGLEPRLLGTKLHFD